MPLKIFFEHKNIAEKLVFHGTADLKYLKLFSVLSFTASRALTELGIWKMFLKIPKWARSHLSDTLLLHWKIVANF